MCKQVPCRLDYTVLQCSEYFSGQEGQCADTLPSADTACVLLRQKLLYKRVGVGDKPDNSVPDNSRTRQQTDTAVVAMMREWRSAAEMYLDLVD